MTLSPAPNSINALFPGNGEMAACCRKVDWSATSLGSVDGWEPALRHALRTTMECPFAICLWCGPEKILIYNDAYTPLLGAKHPRALGRPGAEVWAEAWSDIGPVFEVMEQGNPVYAEDGHFLMERSGGIAADAWFTYSLSPVRAESGVVVAYLNVASETTARVHAERDLRAARKTAERAEGRLRDVFAQAPGFLGVLNGPDHVYEFVNSSYLQLVGHRELIGRRVIEALPELVSQGFVELLDGVYRSGKPFIGRELPISLQRSLGAPPEERHLDFAYQPLTNPDGSVGGVVVHGSDVTDAVLARHEIERFLQVRQR